MGDAREEGGREEEGDFESSDSDMVWEDMWPPSESDYSVVVIGSVAARSLSRIYKI